MAMLIEQLEKATISQTAMQPLTKFGGGIATSALANLTDRYESIAVSYRTEPYHIRSNSGDQQFTIRLSIAISKPEGTRTVEETFIVDKKYIESRTVNTLIEDALNRVNG